MNIEELVNQFGTLLDGLSPITGNVRLVVNGIEYDVHTSQIHGHPTNPDRITIGMVRQEAARSALSPLSMMFSVDTEDGVHLEFDAVSGEIYKEGDSQVVELWTARGLLRRAQPADNME